MPITKQAIKKLRRDRVRVKQNARIRLLVRDAVKSMRGKPTSEALKLVFTRLDKAAKGSVMHKNRASRLKSRLSHLLKKS